MSEWGVFRCDDAVHIAPCDQAGQLLPPHVLTDGCPCGPTRDDLEAGLRIHHDPGRGGCNA